MSATNPSLISFTNVLLKPFIFQQITSIIPCHWWVLAELKSELFAADNSPHFPFSAATAAHRFCSGIPCPMSSQTRIIPLNDVFANRVLQQINKCTRALHVWSAHHAEPSGLSTSCCSYRKSCGINPSSVSTAAAPASLPQTVPRHPWVPRHPGSDQTWAPLHRGVTTLTEGAESLTSGWERSSWGGTGALGSLPLLFLFSF